MTDTDKKQSSGDSILSDFSGSKGDANRLYQGLYIAITFVMTAILMFYYIFGRIGAMPIRGTFLLFVMALCYFPKSKDPKPKQAADCLMMVLAGASNIYMIVNNFAMSIKYEGLSPLDIFMGAALIILILEGTRRKVGIAMPAIAGVFILYTFFGYLIPGKYGTSHFTVSRIISVYYTGTEGIFGSALATMVSTVFLFVLMGGLMEVTGTGKFFIDISKALCGKSSGGSAKIATICSMLFGSISGSAVANTVATGAFTIPMMKESGYSSPFASAVTAVASTGGQMMPPVMGAGAFLIAELTGTAYNKVVLVSIIPAVLFYGALYLEVHLQAKKQNLKGLPPEQIPNAMEVLKKDGLSAFPLVLLIALIVFSGMSIVYAGVYAVGALLLLGFLREKGKEKILFIFRGIESAAPSIVSTSICCACAGLVIGSVTLTGLSYTFSSTLMNMAAGRLLPAMLLVMVLGFVLGMGLPTTPAFIIMVAVAGSGLVKVGLPILTAYMIIFWFAQSANITPPVCMAAYAAAGISGAKPMDIGVQAVKFGFPIFIIPFLMAYRGILFDGAMAASVYGVVTGFLGVFCASVLVIGYLKRDLTKLERLLCAVASICFFFPYTVTDIVAFATFVVFMFLHFKGNAAAKAV